MQRTFDSCSNIDLDIFFNLDFVMFSFRSSNNSIEGLMKIVCKLLSGPVWKSMVIRNETLI